jgi:hypothetical protein
MARDLDVRRATSWTVPLAAFAASAVCRVLAIWPISKFQNISVSHLLVRRDSGWYLGIALHGYPSRLPARGGSTLGFYPLYPLLVRPLLQHTHLGQVRAMLLVSWVAAAAATVVFYRLALRLCDEEVAHRSVLLFVFAPGAFALTLAYSEGVLLFFAGLCLLMLLERRWALAGTFAALASVARLPGLATAVACAVAALIVLREHPRDLKPLLAPAIAVVGVLAMPLYEWIHVGDPFVYSKAQERGMHTHIDFGAAAVRAVLRIFSTHPTLTTVFTVLGTALLVGGCVLLFRWKPPAPIVAYTLTIVVLTVGTNGVVSAFRYGLAAVPLAIAYGRALRGNAFAVALGISAALFAIVSVAAATSAYTP